MPTIANNVVKFINSRSFLQAEYKDNVYNDNTGTITVDLIDGRRLKIYRVKVMDWLSLYCNTTDNEVNNLTQHYGFCFKK